MTNEHKKKKKIQCPLKHNLESLCAQCKSEEVIGCVRVHFEPLSTSNDQKIANSEHILEKGSNKECFIMSCLLNYVLFS